MTAVLPKWLGLLKHGTAAPRPGGTSFPSAEVGFLGCVTAAALLQSDGKGAETPRADPMTDAGPGQLDLACAENRPAP